MPWISWMHHITSRQQKEELVHCSLHCMIIIHLGSSLVPWYLRSRSIIFSLLFFSFQTLSCWLFRIIYLCRTSLNDSQAVDHMPNVVFYWYLHMFMTWISWWSKKGCLNVFCSILLFLTFKVKKGESCASFRTPRTMDLLGDEPHQTDQW